MSFLRTSIATLAISTMLIPMLVSSAQARQNTTRMSCRQAKDLVYSRGAIVLSTGRNTYDRFVASRAFCPPGDYIKRAFARTRDRRSCPIGYTCTMDNPWEPWRD